MNTYKELKKDFEKTFVTASPHQIVFTATKIDDNGKKSNQIFTSSKPFLKTPDGLLSRHYLTFPLNMYT